jgi:hypothetical protein
MNPAPSLNSLYLLFIFGAYLMDFNRGVGLYKREGAG